MSRLFTVLAALSLTAAALVVEGCGAYLPPPEICNVNLNNCPTGHTCVDGDCVVDGVNCGDDTPCDASHVCEGGKCVLPVMSDVVPNNEDDPNVYACVCECSKGGQKKHRVVLDVCMPEDLNPNHGHATPDGAALQADCEGRVAATVTELSTCTGNNITCECDALAGTYFRDECNGACTGVELADDCSNWDPIAGIKTANQVSGKAPVCVVQSADPPVAIPDPLAMVLNARSSLCDVDGTAAVTVEDEDTKHPTVSGRVHISGAPCPGGTCPVGVSYQTNIAPIEFEGAFFGLLGGAELDQLSAGGASLPAVVSLTSAGHGEVPIAAMRSSGRGRSDQDEDEDPEDDQGMWAQNAAPLDVTVDWTGKTCALSGAVLGGTAESDGSTVSVGVALAGSIVNQPPTAVAGPDRDVECASPSGAEVTLDGSGSLDPDNNIALYQWRFDGRSGDFFGDAEASVSTTQALGAKNYHLKVVDAEFQAHEDIVEVTVVDTTPPEVHCDDAPLPSTIVPSAVPVSYTAFAEDACSGALAVEVFDIKCSKLTKPGQKIDKSSSCVVVAGGATLTIHDSGGVGTEIRWKVRSAEDVGGQATQIECVVNVVKK